MGSRILSIPVPIELRVKDYMGELRYILNKNMNIRTHYDSDKGFGVGLTLNY